METDAYTQVELPSGESIKLEITRFDIGITHVTVGPHEAHPHLELHRYRQEIVQALTDQDLISTPDLRYFEAHTEWNSLTGDLSIHHYEEVPFRRDGPNLVPDRSRYVMNLTPSEYQSIQRGTNSLEEAYIWRQEPLPEGTGEASPGSCPGPNPEVPPSQLAGEEESQPLHELLSRLGW